jgi:hypothetical protein
MLRLALGLAVAVALLYGGLKLVRSRAGMTSSGGGPAGPAPVRRAVEDYRKIEAQNRAALERTLHTVEDSR